MEEVVQYTSVAANGQPIVLSGKVSVPMNKRPKGLILYAHYTISSNDEAPSEGLPVNAKYFREDYVLVMPDYIGFGLTRDSIAPYLDGALTARNCVDMLLAAGPTIEKICAGAYSDSIYICGYSQGGAAALWILKLLEEQYADRIHVKGCFAGSGPYDVASTYDAAVSANKTAMPMTVPLLVFGTSQAYNLNLQRKDFFTPAMEHAYDAWIAPKNKGLVAMTFQMTNHRLDHWMSAAGRDKTQPETQRLYLGLLRSSLVFYPTDNCSLFQDSICPVWRPKAPVYIFHSRKDDIVPFVNAEHLRRCWSDAPNITYDFGNYGNHLRSLFLFSSRVRDRLSAEQ